MIWAIRRLAIQAKMLCAIGSDGLNIKFYLNTLNEAERNDIQTYEGNAHSLRIVASLECIPRRAECA